MPKISKTSKEKKVLPKKKTVPVKAKKAPVKKTAVKSKVVKKTKKIVSKKTNVIPVDIISDDETSFAYTQTKESSPIFSSWPEFSKNTKAEDILEETDEVTDIEPEDNEEYDKQKKFFSDWASQNTPKEGAEKPSLAPNKKSVGLYRRQAIFYLGATLVLLLAVAYLFFAKLTVLVSPQGETINDSVSFDIVGASASSTTADTELASSTNKTIDGDLRVIEVSADKTYQTSSEEISGGDTTGEVTGTVTLINKYNKVQPLVAKTRLLSPDGKLFRLKEAVSIPAGGTVTANVYADKPSADMTIDTLTRFTIPGLWAGIQDRIYAENVGPLTYQTQVKRIIKQSDLDKAKKDINEVLDLKVKNDLAPTTTDKAIVYGDISDSLVTNFNSKIGEEKSDFTVTATKKVVVVTFSKSKAIELAKARLALLISDDKQLSNFNTDQIIYSLEDYDAATKTAEIKAYFTGLMSLKSDSSLIDRNKLVGLNKQQISEYLNTFPEIKDYQLEFSPSFIKTAPTLPDRINIKINN